MTTATGVAQCFYRALAEGDGKSLFDLLAKDFVGIVSQGMPQGVGGRHHGRVAMIADVWGRIDAAYDIEVVPSEYLAVQGGVHGGAEAGGRIVVLGTYRGAARAEDATVDAAFAHVITVKNGRITALQQITDTLRWRIHA